MSALLLTGCTAAFLILTSSDNGGTGVNNAASSANPSCGSCHGNTANPNTSISFTGVPAGGYTPGTTYPVTMTINNASMPKCGFDLYVTGGTLGGNPTGTTLTPGSLNQIRHNTPLTMSSGSYACSFNWTAPAAGGTVTVKVVANAVNGNGTDDSGDQWNTAQFTLTQAPNSVADMQTESVAVYPNPTSNTLTLDTKHQAAISRVSIRNLAGQQFNMPVNENQGKITLSVDGLAAGYYQIGYYQNGATHHTAFIKK